jgi:hypothetical protein
MANLSLSFQRIDYVTDRNLPVTAWRAFAEVAFLGPGQAGVSFSCIVDPGAPFSVIPFSLWHDRKIQWRRLGKRVRRKGNPSYELLNWQEVPCDLGMTRVHLIDSVTGLEAGPFVIQAKFARRRQPKANLEIVAVMGMNFLADNKLRLILDGHKDGVTGFLSMLA